MIRCERVTIGLAFLDPPQYHAANSIIGPPLLPHGYDLSGPTTSSRGMLALAPGTCCNQHVNKAPTLELELQIEALTL